MRKFIVLVLLVILFRLPAAQWMSFTDEQKSGLANLAGEIFTNAIEPDCKRATIRVLDRGDGFFYVDVTCDQPKTEM